MNKKDLNRYHILKESIRQTREIIAQLERRASAVPVVKDTVQASAHEWPYIKERVTVDAYEPKQYTRIKEMIIKCKRELQSMEIDELEQQARLLQFINSLQNVRDRYIMKAIYLEDRPQREIAIDLDLTEGRVSQIHDEILELLN